MVTNKQRGGRNGFSVADVTERLKGLKLLRMYRRQPSRYRRDMDAVMLLAVREMPRFRIIRCFCHRYHLMTQTSVPESRTTPTNTTKKLRAWMCLWGQVMDVPAYTTAGDDLSRLL